MAVSCRLAEKGARMYIRADALEQLRHSDTFVWYTEFRTLDFYFARLCAAARLARLCLLRPW